MSDERPNFEGHKPRECGEHRTVGPHRAWCFDCGEWCYPEIPCVRCEIVKLRALTAAEPAPAPADPPMPCDRAAGCTCGKHPDGAGAVPHSAPAPAPAAGQRKEAIG